MELKDLVEKFNVGDIEVYLKHQPKNVDLAVLGQKLTKAQFGLVKTENDEVKLVLLLESTAGKEEVVTHDYWRKQ